MNGLFHFIRRRNLMPLVLGTTLLLCLFTAALSAASEVILIRDSEIKPYRDAIEGFKSTCDCSVREMDLADLDGIERALRSGPDAVVAVGTRAFRKTIAITKLPVIYTMVMPSETTDAGSNMSGICMEISPETYLTTMKGLFPGAKRIGVLFDPERTGAYVRRAAALAAEKGMTLIPKMLHDPRQAPELLEGMRGKIDILWMLPDATVVNTETIDYLMLFSFRNNIPIFSFSEKYVEKGAVAALRIDSRDMGAQAGEMARGLFQGGKGEGPAHAFARAARLVVNMKVSTKIGAAINGELVRDAEKVQ
jgi:putative ABC transport system substrate-binding protein